MQYRRLPRGCTPEAIENARYRYEETDQPQESIAADLGVHRKTLSRLAREQGWTLRKDLPPRDFPPDLRLLVAAEHAVRAEAEAATTGAAAPIQLSVLDRLERAIEKELAAVETMRATLGPQPQPPADAERTARTLERLTDTLFKVRRLRLPEAQAAGMVWAITALTVGTRIGPRIRLL